MEEEDGRPGARAGQTGPLDAPHGASTLPLPSERSHQTDEKPKGNRRSFDCVDRAAINAAQDDTPANDAWASFYNRSHGQCFHLNRGKI